MDIVFPEQWDREITIRQGAFLPHWSKDGAMYHVRTRLADSLPQSVLHGWLEERKEIKDRAACDGRKLVKEEMRRMDFLLSEKVEKFLDAGHGACWLKRNDIATLVAENLWRFNGKRYVLTAWCIMPNHVHVIVQPQSGWGLPETVKLWKSYTARKIHAIIGGSGTFWQREYFDRLIRSPDDLERVIQYVWDNPDNAGLENWKWRWKFGMEKIGAASSSNVSETISHARRAGEATRAT